jgi:hypothetical protein
VENPGGERESHGGTERKEVDVETTEKEVM